MRDSGGLHTFIVAPLTSHDLVALIHLAGFVTGIVLYAMLAAMTLRSTAATLAPDTPRGDGMSLAVSALGLIWNCIALAVFSGRDFGLAEPSPWLAATGFVALGFLPAAVVHSAVGAKRMGAAGRAIVLSAYLVSAAGGVLHLVAAAHGAAPSRAGLLIQTIGYGAILVILIALAARDRQGLRRSLFVIALAAFAVSAFHLSRAESASTPWPMELIGHHASLLLVFVLLYQDYRFAFADLFLRRALSLVVLVACALTLHVLLAQPLAARLSGNGQSVLTRTVLDVSFWVLTALLYPALRRVVGHFVDRVVLGRVDYRSVREQVNVRISEAQVLEDVLRHACEALRNALDARRATWRLDDLIAPAAHPVVIISADMRASALVRIPTTDAPCYAIELSDFAAGRRLLSDDIALLEWVASLAGRRIDLLRMTSERFTRDTREQHILQLATEAELRALRAQLNPHFLFNTLTTIGHLLSEAPDRALATLYQLTSLLRAVLRPSDGEFVPLGEEVELIASYLAIEQARFEERLTSTFDVAPELRRILVPPLILQPLVENAIKHGISPLARGGHVTVNAALRPFPSGLPHERTLVLTVSDTGAGMNTSAGTWREASGLGLANVEQRLARYYGDRATFTVHGVPGRGTTVTVGIVVDVRTDARVA